MRNTDVQATGRARVMGTTKAHVATALLSGAVGLMACGIAGPPSEDGGRLLWQIDGPGIGTPAVDAATVYFPGEDHEVIAVARETGAVRWRARTRAPGSYTNGKNTVIVGDVVAFSDATVWGFDRATGELRWAAVDGPYGAGYGYLATDGTTLYAATDSAYVYAIDPQTGRARWTTSVTSPPSTRAFNPVVADGVVFVGLTTYGFPDTGGLAALDAATGDVRWFQPFKPERPDMPAGCTGLAVTFGDLVIASGLDGGIRALDRTTGAVRWTQPRPTVSDPRALPNTYGDLRLLTISGSVLIASSVTGYVLAYDAATGQERWRSNTKFGSAVHPLYNDGSLAYVVHLGGQLAAMDIASGAVRWTAGTNQPGQWGEFLGAPAVRDGNLYITGRTAMYAIRSD